MEIFQQIRINGFRRLSAVNLRLRSLNVIIGANGCGKTSLLDVFNLLSAGAHGTLKSTMSDLGGLDSMLSTVGAVVGGKANRLSIGLDKQITNSEPLKYQIELTPNGVSYQIADEELNWQRDPLQNRPMIYLTSNQGYVRYFEPAVNRLVAPDWEFQHLETALSQVPRMYKEPAAFRKRLDVSTYYHVLDVSKNAPVRMPQMMRDAKLPGQQGEDLVTCLYWMRETNPERFEIIEDTLRAAFPHFERLSFPPVAAGVLAMTWKDSNSKHPFFMHQLSEGTLRFLWLITLLYSPELPEVTLIDEPEVSLHPELLMILADCLREASTRTQLIVATHADRLVRFLRPEEVVVMDVDETGATSATRAEDLNLQSWLEEYTLDQVWQTGGMGGRS